MVAAKLIFDAACVAFAIRGVQDNVAKSYYSHLITTTNCDVDPMNNLGFTLAKQLQAQGHSIHLLICADNEGHVIPGKSYRVDFKQNGQPLDLKIQNEDWSKDWTWSTARQDICDAAKPLSKTIEQCQCNKAPAKIVYDKNCVPFELRGVQDHVANSYYSHLISTQDCTVNPLDNLGMTVAKDLQAKGHSIHLLICADKDGHVIPGKSYRVDFRQNGQPADMKVQNEDWPKTWTWYTASKELQKAAAPPCSKPESECQKKYGYGRRRR